MTTHRADDVRMDVVKDSGNRIQISQEILDDALAIREALSQPISREDWEAWLAEEQADADEDAFVERYVNQYLWGWCEPIPGVVGGYGVYDDDEDDPPIFETAFAEDAQALVRVMRWVKRQFDGGEIPT